MRDVHVYGQLATVCGGDKFTMKADTPKQAALMLCANFPHARKVIMENNWHVIRGEKEGGWDMDDTQMEFSLGAQEQPIHFMPAVEGSKKSGGLKVVIGVIIIAIAIVVSGGSLAAPLGSLGSTAFTAGGLAVSYGSIATLGVAIALGGVASMMSPVPEVGDYGDREGSPQSFLFSGAENSIQQGGPVPVVYGQFRVGSTVISSSLDIEEIGFPGNKKIKKKNTKYIWNNNRFPTLGQG